MAVRKLTIDKKPIRKGGGGTARSAGTGGKLDGSVRMRTRETEKKPNIVATPRRTGGGGSADRYGTGGKLDGSVRMKTREAAEKPKTVQQAHEVFKKVARKVEKTAKKKK